jgi:RNA polymerase sigma-70 factor (ECF subfamily)
LSETDEQLMRAYCDGDAAAFDRLYARHRGPLFRYVKRLCNNAPAAEELYQDVWLRVVRGREQWNSEQPFSPWLYRIAHNRVVDFWRAAGGRVEEALEQEPPDRGHWVDVAAHVRDCIERLLALLGVLPEVQRSAFLLQHEAGLSLAQIAEVCGCGRETVKSRLRYANQRLRDGLEDCDE